MYKLKYRRSNTVISQVLPFHKDHGDEFIQSLEGEFDVKRGAYVILMKSSRAHKLFALFFLLYLHEWVSCFYYCADCSICD